MNNLIKQQLVILGMGIIVLFLLMKADLARKQEKISAAVAETETEGETQQEENVTESGVTDAQESEEQSVADNAAAENPNIRVLICSDNYEAELHSRAVIECTGNFQLSYGDTVETYRVGDQITIEPGDERLADGTMVLTSAEASDAFVMPELQRSYDSPAYFGSIQIEQRDSGLLIINELPLETYLCSVVPSEMPSSYPLEALKAQAVCARTYAMKQMQNGGRSEYDVDVDDSVSYQVYNNIAANEQTSQAVEETAGIVMTDDGNLVDAWYYSTSCGIDFSSDLSEEAVFCAFIEGDSTTAYEKDEPWYRWHAQYSLEELTSLAAAQFNIGQVTEMSIDERETNGAIKKLTLQGSDGACEIEGEYNIRMLLQTDQANVTLQDGSSAPSLKMLPSAFFYTTPIYENDVLWGYQLTGGGYGHGNGMSQNGAKHMAESGKGWKEILSYYYGEVTF